MRRLVSCLAVLVLCTCVPTESGSDDRPLTIHLQTSERAFFHCGNMPQRLLLFDPLIGRGETGELEGRLAESWEASDDFLTWTVRLDPEARWHDGEPVTVRDIEFTLRLVSDPDIGYLRAESYTFETIDEHTYRIRHHPGPSRLPQNMYSAPDDWNVYYPRHLLEGVKPRDFGGTCEADFWSRPVGTGPYRWVRAEPQVVVELEANPDYHGPLPAIPRVLFRLGGNPVTELLAGNADAAVGVEPAQALRLTEDPRFRAYYSAGELAHGLIWNQRKVPAFRDRLVRRALTLAIDRAALLAILGYPTGLPLFDVVHSGRQYAAGEVPAPLPFDPAEAARLLDEAGWRDTNGDGVREKNGEAFRFTAMAHPEAEKEAVAVQAWLRAVGIRMEIQVLDYATSLARRRDGDFEAAFHFVRSSIVGRGMFDEDSSIGTSHPDVAEQLSRAWGAFDPDETDAMYRDLWPFFQRELPVTFLAPGIRTHVADVRLKGLQSPGRANPILELPRLRWEEQR